MRDPEQQRMALECLKLACIDAPSHETAVKRAAAYFGFVCGSGVDPRARLFDEFLADLQALK